MISLSTPPSELCLESLSLFYTTDALLDDLPVLVFYGPSTTGNSTKNSSRIQAHVYTLAGFQSFPRLTIAPTSPLYAAVAHLPLEQQGDEISRGLAVSLLSYFAGLPKAMKTILRDRAAANRLTNQAPMMFDEMHAGDLAASMTEIEKSTEIAHFVTSALAVQAVSWVDMHVVLPQATIKHATPNSDSGWIPKTDEFGLPVSEYGQYSQVVASFGEPAFLPTAKIQRAPSRPTAHSRSKLLSKDQKITLRREMCELVDTEKSYVDRFGNLTSSMANDIEQKGQSAAVLSLFPESSSQILKSNRKFYDDLQVVLDETENEAIADIESSVDHRYGLEDPAQQSNRRDPTGTAQIAKILLRWFPQFVSPYQDYLRASIHFPALINEILKDDSSSVPKYLHSMGEQRLKSALIEPVQRLPRYSLFIDNIVSTLPSAHPALASLFKARDIISDICALDDPATGDNTRSARTLKDMVLDWPTSFSPVGRLLSAVDVVELKPPFTPRNTVTTEILLVIGQSLVVLRKLDPTALAARGVLAEVDRPTMRSNAIVSSIAITNSGLQFKEEFDIAEMQITEAEDGKSIRLTDCRQFTASDVKSTVARSFALLGSYEGKAAKLIEEIMRARIETFFPENIRESGKWALRSISPSSEKLGVLVALSDASIQDLTNPSRSSCQIQVSIDGSNDPKIMLERHKGAKVAACITTSASGGSQLEIVGVSGLRFTDSCSDGDIAAVLLARLANLIRVENQPNSPSCSMSNILWNQRILASVPFEARQEDKAPRNFRPLSPVKMISNLLGSVSLNHPNTPLRSRHNSSLATDDSSIPPPVPSKSNAEAGKVSSQQANGGNVTPVGMTMEAPTSSLAPLEESFNAYIIALRSRSGNVIGRVLRGRATAQELAVNELYNIILEDPSRIQAAAEVAVDVLFAAFEKFLLRAWQERMGPLFPADVLRNLQSAFDSGKATRFTQEVHKSLEEMPPQNTRAVAAAIQLLSELLDASGNDGDRGALMASFAEALFSIPNPHDYIMLLDRLVDDRESLFDDAPTSADDISARSATGSLRRNRSFNTGSLSSNTSSLRKKFGFGTLTRENSRNEGDSKVASIWRTLSKNSKTPGDSQSQPPSISKGSITSLTRSRSTDTVPQMLPPLRPPSRDRPTSSGSATSEELKSRPGSAHMNVSMLSSIGENTPTKPSTLVKKKRRSSLSDLKSLPQPEAATPWLKVQSCQPINVSETAHPQTPTKPSIQSDRSLPQVMRSTPPKPHQLDRRRGSPQRQEKPKVPDKWSSKTTGPKLHVLPTGKDLANSQPEEVVITTFSRQKRETRTLAPKDGLTERAWPSNANCTLPVNAASSPKKLRMQSPQKIRERLNQEQKTLTISDESFQAEMTKISDEMAKYKIHRSPVRAKAAPPLTSSGPTNSTPTLDALSSRLTALQNKLSDSRETHKTTFSTITSDLESSLIASEKKAHQLDELYREANAENEALYERFNDELGRILGRVKRGDGVEEMKSKLKEAQDEVVRVRKENSKLKREAVGLRSMIRDE